MVNIGEIVKTYLFVQVSMLVFIAPFYLLFARRTGQSIRHLHLNEHALEFFESKEANWLVFFWAMAETTFWFVIPEFLLVIIIFVKVKNKVSLITYDLLGTIVGTILGLIIANNANISLVQIPFISEAMVDQTRVWLGQLNVFGLLFQPFSGVPYKTFVFLAHDYNLNPIFFLIAGLVVRIGRYAILYMLFQSIYPLLHRFISKNYVPIFFATCFVFAVMLLLVYYSYGPSYTVDESIPRLLLELSGKK